MSMTTPITNKPQTASEDAFAAWSAQGFDMLD